MNTTPQTEASRLADELRAELLVDIGSPYKTTNVSKRLVDDSATELRRLVAENQQLVAKLDQLRELLTKATVTERKACAKVVRQQSFFRHFDANMARDQCYAAILARGDK